MTRSEYHLGSLILEPRRRLLRNGAAVPLGRKALFVLSVLAEAEGRLVTKDELMAAIWPGLTIEENAIQVHVAALRKALAEEAGRIETVRGIGYRLEVPAPAVGPGASAGTRRHAIAVLPFANLSGDPSRDYVGDGLAEELIYTLSRAAGLRVPARTSTFAYKGRNVDVRQIASDLGVDTVLEGSVRAAGEHIRVTAQLIDAKTGFHLWSQSFDRRLDDLLALQDEIAGVIARSLDAHLEAGPPPTRDSEAFHLILQSRALVGRPSPENLRHAVALCREAIERDPGFARGYLGLASVTFVLRQFGGQTQQCYDDVVANVGRALALDPGLAEAWGLAGSMHAITGRWLDARAAFDRTPESDDATALIGQLVQFLLPLGYLRAGRALAERAFALAPAQPTTSVFRAMTASLLGKHEEAMRRLDVAEVLGNPPGQPPATSVRAQALLATGRPGEAADQMMLTLPESIRAAGGAEIAARVYAAIASGTGRDAAVAAMEPLWRASERDDMIARWPVMLGIMLDWYIRLGAIDMAFAVAARTVEGWERTGYLEPPSLLPMWIPDHRAFRADPRFQDHVERLGMIDYWAVHGPPDGYALRGGRLVPV